eukprot:PhF_6_TR40753/c0_g1_i2/m.61376
MTTSAKTRQGKVVPFDKVASIAMELEKYSKTHARRAVVIVFENHTTMDLTYVKSQFSSGQYFLCPPDIVPAQQAAVFVAVNRKVSVMTGVNGMAIYESPLHALCLSFDSPYVGTYKSFAQLKQWGYEF